MTEANKIIESCKEKLKSNHSTFSSKSCLKFPLAKYLQRVQLVDIEALTALLDKDIEICEKNLTKGNVVLEEFN